MPPGRASDLYGLPLEEFTRARDELARELRRAGDRDAADEVKALRKPSISAWAVNQAVRRSPQEAKALVDSGTELRKAQRGAISGRGPEALRDATRTHRAHVEALTDAARAALAERGAVAPAVINRVAQTLRATSVDKEAAKALLRGTLAEDMEQSGFGPFLAAVPPRAGPRAAATRSAKPKPKPPPARKPKPPPKPKPKPDPNAARRATLERELERARGRVRELEERLRELERS